MGGPISFLLGLLMLGGSGASYAAENARTESLVDYKHYWEGHPRLMDITGIFRDSFESRMKTLGFDSYEGAKEWIEKDRPSRYSLLNDASRHSYLGFNEKYPQFQRKRFYGPFDLPKLRAELEPKELYDMLYKWTVLQYGIWIYMTEEEWNRIDKYLWSGDYLYDKISWANFLVEKYDDMYEPYRDSSEIASKFQEFEFKKHLYSDNKVYTLQWAVQNNHFFYSTRDYETAKQTSMNLIDKYIVRDVEKELVDFLKQLDVRKEKVPLRFKNHNKFFDLLREPLNQPRYDITQIPAYDFYDDVINGFYYNGLPKENYYDYVQMLHQNREEQPKIQVTLKLSQEAFNEAFGNNHYLQMCSRHEKNALEIAEKYEIEEYNLTKWDICQMTKARPTGPNYTMMCEDPEGYYFIREHGWVPKYFENKRFRGSSIDFLQQQIDANKQEFCKLLRENSRFFIDFFKCVFVESLQYEFSLDTLINNAFEADDYPKKDEQRYKALLQEAIDEYQTWIDVVDTTEKPKPQLKLRQPNNY